MLSILATVNAHEINMFAGDAVNGTTGEGICMDLNERKAVAEAWVKAAKKTNQTIMIQVGGCCLKEVKELVCTFRHFSLQF